MDYTRSLPPTWGQAPFPFDSTSPVHHIVTALLVAVTEAATRTPDERFGLIRKGEEPPRRSSNESGWIKVAIAPPFKPCSTGES